MSDEQAGTAPGSRPWHVPMTGRDPDEPHRAATPLELLFDLCFVVAVAQAAGALHHDLAEASVAHGLISYLAVFFAIWWPWVNFTWFASAYDTDDVLYRLLTFVQIAGVLVVTAGVPSAFENLDFRVMVVGYVIMRIAFVGQWLRVAREDPEHRRTALRFAGAIALIQVGWAIRLAIPPPAGYVVFLGLLILELLVPVYAETAGRTTPWNSRHITERYGLFTIIVIGECVLAATTAVQAAFTESGVTIGLLAVAIGALLLVFASWWVYFKDSAALPAHVSLRGGIAWGYGHYAIFAAVAALGAGLQVAAETVSGHGHLAAPAAAATVAVPAAIYVLAAGVLHRRAHPIDAVRSVAPALVALVVAAVGATWVGVPIAVLAMGVALAAFVGVHVARTARSPGPARAAAETTQA